MNGRQVPFVVVLLMCSGCYDPVAFINDFLFTADEADNCETILVNRIFADPEIQNQQVEFIYDEHLLRAVKINGEYAYAKGPPASLDLVYYDFSVKSELDHTINGWFIPAQPVPTGGPKGTVLLSNPSQGTRECYFATLAAMIENGFHAVVYDYPGFADSTGEKDFSNIVPSARAVLEWIIDDPDPARQRIVVFGLSLGTGPSIKLAGEYPEYVFGALLDSTFTVPTVQNLPSFGLLFDPFVQSILDAFPDNMDTLANIPNVTVPVLMIHGHRDTFTPAEDAIDVFLSAPLGYKFIEFDARHASSYIVDPEFYRDEVLSFLNLVLSPESTSE